MTLTASFLFLDFWRRKQIQTGRSTAENLLYHHFFAACRVGRLLEEKTNSDWAFNCRKPALSSFFAACRVGRYICALNPSS
nr:unnamed protein product [Spirometra erinaceieuropaei]